MSFVNIHSCHSDLQHITELTEMILFIFFTKKHIFLTKNIFYIKNIVLEVNKHKKHQKYINSFYLIEAQHTQHTM